jgi:HEAT repeat protein
VGIRASSSKQIDALVADLASADTVKREAAIARLTVLGARAVERVTALCLSPAASSARTAAFRALEGIADPRAFEPALQAVADADPGVAVAAIAVVRLFVRSARAATAVDRLTAVTLERRRPEPVRLAALRALQDLDAATIAPLLKSLSTDPSDALRAAAAAPADGRHTAHDPLGLLARAASEGLPDDPDSIRQAIAQAGHLAPLPHLLRIAERVRDREGSPSARRRGENWAAVRASAHIALAERGSRLGVYDLRESLEWPHAPLPVEFLTALSLVGDASCLEAIARAHAEARDAWWRDHLASTFHDILVRERLTKRHAALRRIEQRWPGALERLGAGGSAGRGGEAGRAGKAGR